MADEARDPRGTDSRTHWETVYSSKGRENLSWYEESPDTSTALVLTDGVPQSVIDVGAGASMLPDALLDAGVEHVTLLDLSMSALALTSVRLEERANRVTTIVGDVLTHVFDERYDVWHDRAVFHFLTNDVDRRHYVRLAERTLKLGGSAVMATFAWDGPERCSGLAVQRYDAGDLVEQCGQGFELIRSERYIHPTPSGSRQNFLFATFHRVPGGG